MTWLDEHAVDGLVAVPRAIKKGVRIAETEAPSLEEFIEGDGAEMGSER